MDTRDWHILWGVPPKYDNENNGAMDDNATLAANVFYASTLSVILQRLMPFYRLRQTGESMTLLLKATHIDIATAMALWILGIGTSCGVCHPSMTTKVMALWTIMQHLPLTFFTPPLSTSFSPTTPCWLWSVKDNEK